MKTENRPGQRVKILRKNLGLTLAKFGEKIATSPATISSWEQGKADPRKPTLFLISKKLGVNLEWLETGAGPISTPPEPSQSIEQEQDGGAPPIRPGSEEGVDDRRDDERQEQDGAEDKDDGAEIEVIQRVFDLLTVDQQNAVVKAITLYLERKASETRDQLKRLECQKRAEE